MRHRNKSKHVYVLQRPDGLVKIGVSKDPETRVKTLSMQGGFQPLRVEVSEPVTNAFEVEREAHRKFAGSRSTGEWFDIDVGEAVELVRDLCGRIGKTAEEVKPEPEVSESNAPQCGGLSGRERQILRTLTELLPQLSELEKEKLLAFGEGMAFVKSGTPNCIKEVKSK